MPVKGTEQVRVATIYNPQNQSKGELIGNFVVRQLTFQRLFKAIKAGKMEVPEQHYVILGRRGMGKTTLLLRLAYEIENDPELNDWMLPLIFNEEEYGIRRLFKFWERIMDLLEQRHPDFRFDAAERRQLSMLHKDDDAYERALFDRLAQELERSGKKLVLFIDNFGDMAGKLSDAEARRLRKILQTFPALRIIAASAEALEAFYSYEHPFYEFFKITELRGLNEKETRDLLLNLAQHYKKDVVTRIVEHHPGRVEALRRITGGVIRTIVLLFEIFADDEDGSAFKDLEVVLDRVTPLYKHRMDDLSDQQQAIVEAIALNWDALSVKEIAERTRLESKIISAQLQQLERSRIIMKIPTKTKNNLYIVAERFFNVWYLMRNGSRGDEKRVLWLVRFFEEWCDDDMMKLRADLHKAALERGKFDPEAALIYTVALARTKRLKPSDNHELIKTTKEFLLNNSPRLARYLQASDLDVVYSALTAWFMGQEQSAIHHFENIYTNILEDVSVKVVKAFKKTLEPAQYWKVFIPWLAASAARGYEKLSAPEWEKIEQCYIWIIESIPKVREFWDTVLISSQEIGEDNLNEIRSEAIEGANKAEGFAYFHLGEIYRFVKRELGKAMEFYKKAIILENINAMVALGEIYINEDKKTHAGIELLKKVLEKEENNFEALFCIGAFYFKTDNYKEAIYWFKRAADLGYPPAKLGLSVSYFNIKLFKEDALRLALDIESDSTVNNEHKSLCLAFAMLWNNQLNQAINSCEQFLLKSTKVSNLDNSINSLFILLFAKKQFEFLFNIFTKHEFESLQLKDRFKPIYYAVLKKLDHPDFLRMGEELAQTVDEVLARADQMAIDYA